MFQIPFKAETIASLRARYPDAVAEAFDTESVKLGNAVPPGRHRRNCFDHRDGYRLIVSRDICPCECEQLTVSLWTHAMSPGRKPRDGKAITALALSFWLKVAQPTEDIIRIGSFLYGESLVILAISLTTCRMCQIKTTDEEFELTLTGKGE